VRSQIWVSTLHVVFAYAPVFTGTHCVFPRKDGQAELTWVAWLHTKMVCSVIHLPVICPSVMKFTAAKWYVIVDWQYTVG